MLVHPQLVFCNCFRVTWPVHFHSMPNINQLFYPVIDILWALEFNVKKHLLIYRHSIEGTTGG